MKKLKHKLIVIKWAISLALKINKKIFIFWVILSILVALLPAVALYYNQNTISIISDFLSTGVGTFATVTPSIIMLGIILTLIGLSGRINNELLYFAMYDYYYLGMEEFLMDCIQKIEMKTLLDKNIIDEYRASKDRAGSLTDFMSSSCLFLSKFIGIVSLLFIANRISIVLFVVAFLYVLIVITLNFLFAKKARWDAQKVRGAERRAHYYEGAVTNLGVAKEIRVYKNKEDIIQGWEDAYNEVKSYEMKNSLWRQFLSFISGFGFYICISLMIFYTIFQIANNSLSVDIFLMLYMLGHNMSDAIKHVTASLHDADRGLFSLERQYNFVTTIPQTREKLTDEDTLSCDSDIVFEAKKMFFSYDDKKDVLKNLSFQIKKGETIALVGANGSGKTTLVKLLIELYKPTNGSLYFYDKPYSYYKSGFINRNIGMFFQQFYIFHATLRENVGFGDLKNMKNDEKILEAIQKGGAVKVFNKLSEGLEHWITRAVKKTGAIVSGGEMQKIAVSRAHMSDKDILIFDEPAAALDPIAEMEQFYTIKEKIKDRTAILISHRVGFARMADRIFVLDNGCLVEVGTHESLLHENGIYATFFHRQAEWYKKDNN